MLRKGYSVPRDFSWIGNYKLNRSKQHKQNIFKTMGGFRKLNRKNKKTNKPVIRGNFQKHLGLFLDSKLYFSGHINEKTRKVTTLLRPSTLLGK